MKARIVQPWRKSHKALGVDEVLDDALASGINTIAVISSGNYVGAISEGIKARDLSGRLRVVNLVNQSINNGHAEVIIQGRRILRPGEREAYILEQMPEAGIVRDYTDFQPRAYDRIARGEIVAFDRFAGKHPDYVSLGVGSGKLFLAIERAIREQGLTTKLIGILPKGENGVFNEGQLVETDGRLFTKDPFNPQTIADKLSCPFTALRSELLAAQEHGHVLAEVGNNDFYSAFVYARNARSPGEPSATAGLIIHDPEFREKYGIHEDSFCVVVHTGYGEFAKWVGRIQQMRPPMPPAIREAFGLPPLTSERLADIKSKIYLRAKPWAYSNRRVGSENLCS
jgi:hypothetical protein